ncbi:MAG: hypothetical protein JW726_12885 [Anaerolineales bacterium]|nr:hypothetical protein [Anaerolineales bacterium]
MNNNIHPTSKQSSQALPRWEQLLHDRRISDETIQLAQLKQNRRGNGWEYPAIDPHTAQAAGRRFKKFPDTKGPNKYRWLPRKKSSDTDWYMVGERPIVEIIAANDGILWFANGEPDVWALHSAGIHNAVCTTRGEANLPSDFVDALESWGVTTLHIAPDLDEKGTKHAEKVAAVVADSEITLVTHVLPEELGDKADIGKAWEAYEGEEFSAWLLALPATTTSCEAYPAESDLADTLDEVAHSAAESKELPQEFYDAIEQALGVQGYRDNGFSKPVRCPLRTHEHEDERPGAGWHRDKHILHCFKCHGDREFALAIEVGELLGLDWRDYIPSSSREDRPVAAKTRKRKDNGEQAKKLMPTVDEFGDTLIAQKDGNLAYFYGAFYTYDQGVWTPYKGLDKEIYDLLKSRKLEGVRPTKGLKVSVEDYIKAHVRVDDQAVDAGDQYLNLANGMLNLETLELEPHQRELYFTTQLDYSYDPDADCPQWRAFLDQVLVNEDGKTDPSLIDLLQEALGYSLTPDTSLEKAFLLNGEAASGKSTILSIVQRLLATAHAIVDFSTLSRNQYQLAAIPGKRVITCSEAASNTILTDNLFKQLVSGEEMLFRQIYAPTFSAKPQAKVWWAMNQLPQIEDRSDAVFRRLILFPFFRTVPEEQRDTYLKDRLFEELPGILNWALQGLTRLRENGRFTKSELAEAELKAYQRETQVEATFVEERLVDDPNGRISAELLFQAYRDWCEANGLRYLNKSRLGRVWKKLDLESARANQGTVYVGIKLVAPGSV